MKARARRGEPRRLVPDVLRAAGRTVRATDERWEAAWLAAIDPAPSARVARAAKAVRLVSGQPPASDQRLLAIVELQIARIHLARAQSALHDPSRKRQAWLFCDVQRAEKTIDRLAHREARGGR